jgi:hypothetical protein
MMNICSNTEEQSDPKLIEYRQVVDRVREAGRRDSQEIGKLEKSNPTLNGYGNGYFTSPTPSSDGKLPAKARNARPEQDPDAIAHEVSASRSGGAHLRGKSSIDQAPAFLVTPKGKTKNSRGKGEARRQTSVLNPQRPFSSSPPEEEQAQLGQRLAKPKRDGEARKSQALGDGKTSDFGSQQLFLSEAPDEEMVQADKNTTESSESRHPL